MPKLPNSLFVWLTAVLVLFVSSTTGCGSSQASPGDPADVDTVEIEGGMAVAAPADGHGWSDDGPQPAPGQIPVTRDDPTWGNALAPVTIVAFMDFECPYCVKVVPTLEELRADYGPDQLRIAFKHNPLPFHKQARPAAEVAVAVHRLGGPDAFWTFHDDLMLKGGGRLSASLLDRSLERLGIARRSIQRQLDNGADDKVAEDMALAKRLGAMGTPAFFINGVFLSGAQPAARFREIVEAELRSARRSAAEGISADRMYAHRTARNIKDTPPPSRRKPGMKEPDTTVHRVPVGKSPTLGKPTALVTLVMFSEFQCPFCGKVQPTLEKVRKRYGDDVRMVFKHNPLPFHKRAIPAARFTIEARKQRGDAGFWAAHDALFADQKSLEDADLQALAQKLRLNEPRVMRAIGSAAHDAVIDDDQDLAIDVKASGTPHFFVNGRRLTGAQPFGKFADLIDEELAKAKAMAKRGVARQRVYDEIMKTAVGPTPPETKAVPAPPKSAASRGPKNAPVVIQAFLDFQCPFCDRVQDTLDDLQKKFPKHVRVVFRHKPLPFHNDAPEAHRAALEAKRQKGSAGFWAMHNLLFENQKDLSRSAILGHGKAIGLDVRKLEAALERKDHQSVIDADLAVADVASISGTPAFVINGYFISGAQPLRKFEKIVKLAIDDLKKKPTVKVAAP